MGTTPVRSLKRVSDHHVSFIYTNGCFMDFRLGSIPLAVRPMRNLIDVIPDCRQLTPPTK